MKTRDGADFTWGMTLITENGREIPTSESEHAIDILAHHGGRTYRISRKNGSMSTDLLTFYSSQEARIRTQVERLEAAVITIQKEIDLVKDGAIPRPLNDLLRYVWPRV